MKSELSEIITKFMTHFHVYFLSIHLVEAEISIKERNLTTRPLAMASYVLTEKGVGKNWEHA